MEHIWFYSAVIFGIVILSKIIALKTSTIDVLWLILFGSVFSNIGIIPEHNEILEYIGEWGIVFIMFALGLDENLSHFFTGLKRSMGIAIIGALFPFLAGFYSAKVLGYDSNSAMLWGLTMTATAVSLTMMSLREENLHKSTAATGIMTAAVVDDILSLIGVAIIVPLVISASNGQEGSLEMGVIFTIIVKVFFFFCIVLFVGLFVFPERSYKSVSDKHKFLRYFVKIGNFSQRYLGVKKFVALSGGLFTPLIMVFIAMAIAAIAHFFGFHPAIGAYLAGLFLQKEYFIFHKRKSDENYFFSSKRTIDTLAFIIFGPIFFVNLGAKLVFDFQIFQDVFLGVILLFSLVFVLQILSASFAAKYTGSYRWHESVMIGFGMLGRAELAFIVIDIAFVDNKIIDIEQFYTLIMVTFLLNISVPLVIKWWKPYYAGEKEFFVFGVKLSR